MVQTRICKVNPIKKIPSPQHTIVFHPFTHELYKNGQRYGSIRNGIFVQKVKQINENSFWDLSIIKYFHIKSFRLDTKYKKLSFTSNNIYNYGKIKINEPDILILPTNLFK